MDNGTTVVTFAINGMTVRVFDSLASAENYLKRTYPSAQLSSVRENHRNYVGHNSATNLPAKFTLSTELVEVCA